MQEDNMAMMGDRMPEELKTKNNKSVIYDFSINAATHHKIFCQMLL